MKVLEFVSNQKFDSIFEQIDFAGIDLKSGRGQFFIVPDRFSLSLEKMIMERLDLVASFDFEVLSLSRLASLVLGKNFNRKVLGMLDAVMIVEFLLKKNQDEFLCFSKIPFTTNFAKSLFDSISQIKSCKITPLMLKASVEKLSDSNLKLKMMDISKIYELYENYIKDNFVDSNNKLGLLCEKLKNSKIFDGKDVHFCGFNDFTIQDFDVIKESIKCAHQVSIGLIKAEKGQDNADFFLTETENGLKVLFEELNIVPEIIVSKNFQTDVQKHISSELFSLTPKKMEIKAREVELFSAENLEEEVDFVLKKTISLLGDGVKLSDICVCCCDMGSYEKHLENGFLKYGLPFWIDSNITLDTTDYFKLLSAVFDLLKYDFQTEDVLRVVFNGLSSLSQKQREGFEFFANKFGFSGNLWKKKIELKNNDEDFEKFEKTKKEFFESLLKFQEDMKESKTFFDFSTSLEKLLEKLNLKEKCEDFSAYFEEKGDLRQASIFRQCHQKFLKVLEQIKSILGDEDCSFEEFVEIFEVCVSSSELTPLPMGINNIFVGQMLSTVFEPKPYYFVLGATEEKLPAFMKDVGIISDSDIEKLLDVDITPTIKELNKKTILTVIQNLSLATKNLFLSYPRNVGSSQCEPSQVFNDLKNMFHSRNFELPVIEISKYLKDDNAFGGRKNRMKFLFPTKNDVVAFLFENYEKFQSDPKFQSFALKFLKREDFLIAMSQNKMTSFVKNGENLFFSDGFTKTTEVEKYFACPFLHFVQYGLKLKENETNKVEAVDVGNILHDIVEKFAIFAGGDILDDEKIETFAKSELKNVLESKEYEHFLFGQQNKVLAFGLEKESIRICKAINYQNKHSKYKIKFVEANFGSKGFASMPEIAVFNSKRILKMRGKVDRVDFCDKKFRVIDYKTGKSKSDFSLLELFVGKKIQLFVYLRAIQKSFLDMTPTGAFYFPLHNEYLDEEPTFPFQNHCMNGVSLESIEELLNQDDQLSFEKSKSAIVGFSLNTTKSVKESGTFEVKKDKKLVKNNELLSMMNYSEKVMSKAIAEILEGFVEAKPDSTETCNYCKAKSFCPMIKLKLDNVRRNDFDVTKEIFEGVVENG